MSLNYHNHYGLPNESQKLLLSAALFDTHKAIEAWLEWLEKYDFDNDIDYSLERILPMVYFNLNSMGFGHELMPKLRHSYLRAVIDYKLLKSWALPAINSVQDAGFETLVLKGFSVGKSYYPKPFLRPMSDIDILVRKSEAKNVLRNLESSGWQPVDYFTKGAFKYRHSGGCINPDGNELDLHWSPLSAISDVEAIQKYWDRSKQIVFEELETRRLDTTDELIHCIVHGVAWNPMPPVRWVEDAVLLLRKSSDNIDWDYVISFAIKHRLSFKLNLALQYLRSEFDANIPQSVLKKLEGTKSHWLEKHEDSDARMLSSIVNYWRYCQSIDSNIEKLYFIDFLVYKIGSQSRRNLAHKSLDWIKSRLSIGSRNPPQG